MPWYLAVIAVAGGLLLIFALVEWLYTKVEPSRDSRQRAFLGGGLVCFVVLGALNTGVTYQAKAAESRRIANVAAITGPLAALEYIVTPHLQLIESIADAQVKPTKADLLGARQQLLNARRQVAAQFDGSLPTRSLQNQSDALLGVAYNTLGLQWTLAKEGLWDQPEQRALATGQLQSELVKWKELHRCLASGRTDCSPALSLHAREATLRDFNRWLHPYAVELGRFQENDPDLIDLSAPERARLKALLDQGRAELMARDMELWAEPVRTAADKIFEAAQLALVREQGALSQGQWDSTWQATAYQPVREAMQSYLQTALCSSESSDARCNKLQ